MSTTNYVPKWNGSAYNDSTAPIYEDGSGNVGIKTTSPQGNLNVVNASSYNYLRLDTYSTGANHCSVVQLLKSQNNTSGNMTRTDKNTRIGLIEVLGVNNSSQFTKGAQIGFWVDPNTDPQGYVPTDMEIRLATAAADVSTVMMIKSSGNVGINTTSPSEKLDVNGNIKCSNGQVILPSYSKNSLPTGVEGGMIYVNDEAGGKVPAFYDGTNWRRVTDRAIVS